MSLPVALRLASSFDAASSLSSGDTLRGLPMIACWMSASSLCASSTSLVPSSNRRRDRSSIDSISTSRPGRVASAILVRRSLSPLLPGLGRGDVGAGIGRGQDLNRRRSLVDDTRIGIPDLAADAELGAVTPGDVEQADLARAARRGTAEQCVDRLLLRLVRGH